MLNNCTFQGRFAADPEMRTTQSGLTVASFRMAVDRDNVGQDGQRATDWLNFVAWRKTAEFVDRYFHKGSMAIVECQCQTRSYEDRNGQKRTATEFVVQKIHFCGPKTERRGTASGLPAVLPAAVLSEPAAAADGLRHPEPAAGMAAECPRRAAAQLLAGRP